MSDSITPLTTEHLRSMREDISLFRAAVSKELAEMRMSNEEGFGDMRRRLTRVEHGILGLKRDETDTAT